MGREDAASDVRLQASGTAERIIGSTKWRMHRAVGCMGSRPRSQERRGGACAHCMVAAQG